MKQWIPMVIILLAVVSLCVWDGIHINKVFNTLETKTETISRSAENTPITDEDLQNQIFTLNDYWTKEMDTLCVSISRKDLQIISDYLQYLCAACINESQEDAVTYSKLLNYNIIGLKQCNGINMLNLL